MKPKRKAAPSDPLSYFWHELLFTRDFEFEVDASPKACADAIKQQLAYAKDSLFGNINQVVLVWTDVEVAGKDYDDYAFSIEAKRKEKSDYGLIAETSGTIIYDPYLNHTIVSGEAHFGFVNYMLLASVVLMFTMLSIVSTPSERLLYIPFFGGILILGLWQMFADRNRIFNELRATLDTIEALPEETIHHLTDDATADVSTMSDISDDQPYQDVHLK